MRRIIPLNSIINLYLIISSVVDLSDLHIPGNTNRSDDGYKNYIEISLTSIVNFVDSKWVKFDSEHTIFRSTNVTLGNLAIPSDMSGDTEDSPCQCMHLHHEECVIAGIYRDALLAGPWYYTAQHDTSYCYVGLQVKRSIVVVCTTVSHKSRQHMRDQFIFYNKTKQSTLINQRWLTAMLHCSTDIMFRLFAVFHSAILYFRDICNESFSNISDTFVTNRPVHKRKR